MELSTATAANVRRRSLIALLTTAAALLAGAYALVPPSALAYQEVDPDCMGAICPVAGDGGEPAGDPVGDEADYEEGETDDSGAQYGDRLIDPPVVDPSLIWRAGNPLPVDGGWTRWNAPPALESLEKQRWRKSDGDWDGWVESQAHDALSLFDPSRQIRIAADCERWTDPVRCGLLGIVLRQGDNCEILEEALDRNPGDPTLAAKRMADCEETEEALSLVLQNWIELWHKGLDDIARKHRKHQGRRAKKNHHRSVGVGR
jgi:hypothetical protein